MCLRLMNINELRIHPNYTPIIVSYKNMNTAHLALDAAWKCDILLRCDEHQNNF